MTIGMIFYIIAAVILFVAGIGVTAIPNPMIWGLFCIAIGLLWWCLSSVEQLAS
jgi:hypothetical protein